MNKIWKGTLVSGILLVICWFGFDRIGNFEVIRVFSSVYAAISFVCFLVTGTVTQIRKQASPYAVFAAVSFVIGIGITIFSIYDIQNDADEWFKGLVGTVFLVFVIPFILLLLVADLIVWKKNKAKNGAIPGTQHEKGVLS